MIRRPPSSTPTATLFPCLTLFRSAIPRWPSILADVLVPHFRVGRDPVAEHADAALVGEVNHVDAVLAQPLDPAVEIHRLAHHHGADVELPHQAAAVPARRQRGDHDGVALAALPAGLADDRKSTRLN